MNTRTRLQKVERVHKQHNHSGRGRVFVYYEGQDFGNLDGAQISLADFEATRRDNDTLLTVCYIDGKKVTDIGGAGGGAVKRYIGISPLDWDNPERIPE
jgi:hypothetical protein